MTALESVAIAFSVYSRIPMPRVTWNEKNKRWVLVCFPLVGVVIGLVEVGVLRLAVWAGLPSLVIALLLIAVPLLLTGGIHADGLIDTMDARHSYAPREKKLEILKDPHIGAFAVIRGALYLIILLAAMLTALSFGDVKELSVPLIFIFLLSRTLSGYAGTVFPKAKEDGLLAGFVLDKRQSMESKLLFIEIIITAVLFCIFNWIFALLLILLNLVLLLYYYLMSKKEFGGVTGDLAGWFLCMSELTSAVAVALTLVIRGKLG